MISSFAFGWRYRDGGIEYIYAPFYKSGATSFISPRMAITQCEVGVMFNKVGGKCYNKARYAIHNNIEEYFYPFIVNGERIDLHFAISESNAEEFSRFVKWLKQTNTNLTELDDATFYEVLRRLPA